MVIVLEGERSLTTGVGGEASGASALAVNDKDIH